MLLVAYLNFHITKYILVCCFSYLEMLFHTVKIVFFLLTHFRERILLLSKLVFSPKYHKTIFFFCFFPPINDSIMIFSKSSVVSYSCLFFQESLSQMKIAGLWEKTMSLIWILNGSVHRRHLKDVFWDKLICLASLSNDFRINTGLRTVLKVFER